jgi:glycerol kinase
MEQRHVLVIDEGTTGTRVLVIDADSRVLGSAYTEFSQHHPAPDRVEHDAEEIWAATVRMTAQALEEAGVQAGQLAAVGITNQRATTVVWDRATGEPITPAIVWQDTRTSGLVDSVREEWGEKVYARTGWALAPVYSSLSLAWILENVPDARRRAEAGELAFGTIDSWLIHKLTGGRVHAISASNASVTGSYDLLADDWYGDWLGALGVPLSLFPEVRDDSGDFGVTDAGVFGAEIPIASAVADQHAALFAQHCLTPGTVKCTHGTGTFLDMNVGDKPVISSSGLNSIIAWRMNGTTTYGLEGYAAVTGSAVQWLRDGAGLIGSAAETEALARAVPDNGGVYFVPALTGLSAPYWDSYARGTMFGISPGTKREHLVRATLEGIVYSIRDFLETMASDSGTPISTMRADGGASANDFLLQFQADMLGAEVVRPANTEATSLGAAYLAGLATGVWPDAESCFQGLTGDTTFTPKMDEAERDRLYTDWKRAVDRSKGWIQPR